MMHFQLNRECCHQLPSDKSRYGNGIYFALSNKTNDFFSFYLLAIWLWNESHTHPFLQIFDDRCSSTCLRWVREHASTDLKGKYRIFEVIKTNFVKTKRVTQFYLATETGVCDSNPLKYYLEEDQNYYWAYMQSSYRWSEHSIKEPPPEILSGGRSKLLLSIQSCSLPIDVPSIPSKNHPLKYYLEEDLNYYWAYSHAVFL